MVEELGDGVEGFSVGDHVIPCCYANCLRCASCKRSESNFCESGGVGVEI